MWRNFVTNRRAAKRIGVRCGRRSRSERDAYSDPRGARRAGREEARIVELVAEHLLGLAEDAEGLVVSVENVVDEREDARVVADRILGPQGADRVAVDLVEQIPFVAAQVHR